MFKLPRRRLTVVVVVSLAVATFVSVAYADHSWNNYHWAREDNPFTLKLGDNVSSAWDSYLNTTSNDWSQSSVLDTTIVAGQTRARQCKPSSGRVEVCNASYGNNGWLGIAQIWLSGGHISQGVVKLNDTYFNSSTYNTPAWRNLVMCQEVGHTLGLDHVDENFNNTPSGTCMDYSNDPVPNQHPNSHDYQQLANIYQHLDGSTTVGQATDAGRTPPPAMNDIEFSGPEQWGKRIKGSPEKGTSLYELDFGGGHKVYTFVTWAIGEERGNKH